MKTETPQGEAMDKSIGKKIAEAAQESSKNVEHSQIKRKSTLAEIKLIGRLWPYFADHKKLVVITALLVPFIALLASLPAILLKYIIDDGVLAKDKTVILLGSAYYFGMVVLNYLAQVTQSFTAGYAVQKMSTLLRSKLVHHVLTRPARFHDQNMSGALVTRATGDFENLAQSLNQGILTSVSDLAKLFGIVLGMFFLSWEFGCIAILVIIVGSFTMNFFSQRLRVAMLQSRKHSSEMNGFAQEILVNSASVKFLSAETAAAEKFDHFNELNRRSQMKEVTHDANLFSFLDGIAAICMGLALFYVLSAHGASERFTAGTLVAFVQYMFQVFEPLKQLGNKVAMLQGVFTAIERIFGILDVTEKIEGHVAAPELSGKLEVKQLSYRYGLDVASPQILHNVSFSLEAGKSIAIVGRTGSGKSTIVRLLTKLYDGYEGSARFDDFELRDLAPDSLRAQMAVVNQDVVLFNDSILFNVTLGAPELSLEDAKKACALAGADRFIEKLPGTYEFIVSEKGENLSHGQRQLISLARALAHKPKILVLDEATSSVDQESEQIFQAAVENILGKCTVIIIAHRMATIEKCDFVLVLEMGRVAEFGPFQVLAQRQGAFQKLRDALGPKGASGNTQASEISVP